MKVSGWIIMTSISMKNKFNRYISNTLNRCLFVWLLLCLVSCCWFFITVCFALRFYFFGLNVPDNINVTLELAIVRI